MNIMHKLYWRVYNMYWITFAKMNPIMATKSRFKKCLGYDLNLDNPRTLNEKMQWLKLNTYYNNPVVRKCADKYAVRDYVISKGCGEILNPLYHVYSSASEIEWNELPEEFVLKCNHGSGGNIICRNKNNLDSRDTITKLNKWMKQEYGLSRVEYSYEGIPKKIICEKFIETEDEKPPKDYKIFCSYGVPKMVFVASDRYEGNTKFDYYTPEWEWIPVKNGHPNRGDTLPKPKMWDQMLKYASVLSKDFPLVRVDLYCEFGKIIFGELTFLHFGGTTAFDPKEYDRIFGDLFPIDDLLGKKRG